MPEENTSKSSSAEEELGDGPWKEARLPRDILPQKYSLLIHPRINSGTFSGRVLINIKVTNETKIILIHQTNLTIDRTTLTKNVKSEDDSEPEEVLIKKTWAYPENHYWVIECEEDLKIGNYELILNFNGTLSNSTLGLYKSSYSNSQNEECCCVLSYFEATYARSAFPCFDEPSLRAVFHVMIVQEMDSDLVALSNNCREKETEDFPSPGLKTVHFKPTPAMPPYLVALILGDFSFTPPLLASGGKVSVAVYSRPEIVGSMKRAQALAVAVLDFFSEYFDIPYPLPKLDLFALPDSNIGGMENWGLITFREDLLILNEDSTCNDLANVISLIAHEISHMWFGDLVSISWWDNLWLKEGFASYMENFAGQAIFPDWLHDWAACRYSTQALSMDAPLSSHPLVQTVSTTAEIRGVFDAISYCKGACLVRMLRDLDPAGFQAGIRSYLKKYSYRSTVTEDLWEELQETMPALEVAACMETWSRQTGFPLLTVATPLGGSRPTVAQSRFLLDKHALYDPSTSPFQYKWNVPIKYITSNDLRTPKLMWLNKDLDSVALDCGNTPCWVKLNWHQVGYYRVNYPLQYWDLFCIQLIRNHSALDPEDRAGLLDDAFSLASAGFFHYSVPLDLTRYLGYGRERHFYPWAVTSGYLRYLRARLMGTSALSSLLEFIHILLKENLKDNIWDFSESVPFLQKKLQLELINLGCWSEEPQVLDRIRNMFDNWLTDKVLPYPELRSIVYSYGLSGGEVSEEVWTNVLGALREAKEVKERFNIWNGLARVRNEDYLKSLIEMAKDESNLRSQDFFIVLNSMTDHPIGLQVVWDFLRNEWEYLVGRFTLEDPKFCRFFHNVVCKFGSEERLKEVEDFLSYLKDGTVKKSFEERSLPFLERHIHWEKYFLCRTSEWLQQYLRAAAAALLQQQESATSEEEILLLEETMKEEFSEEGSSQSSKSDN